MADFGSPVANTGTYDPQGGLKSLGMIYGIKSAQAEAQQQQQTASQRYGIAQWFKNFDPAKHVSADGTLNLNDALADPSLRNAAGDSYPEVVEHLISIKQGQLQNKQALSSLNQDVVKQFRENLSALRTDPDVVADNGAGRKKLQEAIGQFAATGPDASRIAQIYGPQAEQVPQGKLAQYLSNVQLQAESAGEQASKQAPVMQNVGATQVNVNPQAAGAGQGGGPTLTDSAPIKNTIPPGKQAFTDSFGRTYVFNQQTGNYEPAKSNAEGPGASEPGDVANINQGAAADSDLYTRISEDAKQAPITKNILQNMQLLADKSFTGAGSKELASIEGTLSQIMPGFKGAGDAATDRQLLGKYYQQLALKIAGSNYGTDQGKSMVASAIPDPDHMTPDAIKRASQFISSQMEISQARGAVANDYLQKHGNSSLGLRAVDAQFMNNIDPRMFDAISMNKDQLSKFVKDNFKTKEEWKAFQDKMAVINHLGGFNYGASE